MGRKKKVKNKSMEMGTSLSIFNAKELHDQLTGIFGDADRIEIDLKKITDCDTAGIQLLYSLKKSCLESGKDISLTNPSDAVKDALNRMSVSWETLDY